MATSDLQFQWLAGRHRMVVVAIANVLSLLLFRPIRSGRARPCRQPARSLTSDDARETVRCCVCGVCCSFARSPRRVVVACQSITRASIARGRARSSQSSSRPLEFSLLLPPGPLCWRNFLFARSLVRSRFSIQTLTHARSFVVGRNRDMKQRRVGPVRRGQSNNARHLSLAESPRVSVVRLVRLRARARTHTHPFLPSSSRARS